VDNKPDPQDAPPAAEEAAAPPKKRLPLPKIGIIAGVIVVEIVAAYFLQKTVFFGDVAAAPEVVTEQPKAKSHDARKPKTEKSKSASAKSEAELKVVMLDEIIVNPAGTAGRRYLAVTLGLQTSMAEADKEIEKQSPVIRDALISLLSSLPLDQLASVQYRDSLKLSIKHTINKQLGEDMVDNVVFSNYVLQ